MKYGRKEFRLRLQEIYRITLALVRPFGHVPHLIRAILRTFRFITSPLISRYLFLTLLSFFMFSCVGYNEIWELTLCMGSSFPIACLVGPLFYFPRFLPPP